jgi:hypothetical protein
MVEYWNDGPDQHPHIPAGARADVPARRGAATPHADVAPKPPKPAPRR